MVRLIAVAVATALLTAACTSTGATVDSAAATSAQQAADADLILTMYDNITSAFVANPDDGVRALIAFQDPEDLPDVDFARCVNAILPGATSLPLTKRLHFVPNIATMKPDPSYAVTSDHVKNLHPKGRIYVTDVEINDGGKPTIRQRHQVILNGKAYQFTSC